MSNIKDILERLMSHYKVGTYVELAKKIGVVETTISQWKQREKIPKRNLYRIANKENISYEWLINGEGTKETSTAAAHEIAPIFGFHIPELTKSVKIYTADSLRMSPSIKQTDKLLVDESKTEIISGRVYMLRGTDFTIFPARLFETETGVVVRYDNTKYKEEKMNYEILGQVFYILREI
ncbi:MAG: helix-turn-helix domain-containing protein [Campylobacteraceae bacterium]|nr:helix-turn-helix domain-containing protein [Campylobacteraceae bacterium]